MFENFPIFKKFYSIGHSHKEFRNENNNLTTRSLKVVSLVGATTNCRSVKSPDENYPNLETWKNKINQKRKARLGVTANIYIPKVIALG